MKLYFFNLQKFQRCDNIFKIFSTMKDEKWKTDVNFDEVVIYGIIFRAEVLWEEAVTI